MKIKGLRWIVLSLIALVTIINYLDRGTLNYMWIANTKHTVAADAYVYDEAAATYRFTLNGTETIAQQAQVAVQADGSLIYTEDGGIAKDLGLIDLSASEEEQQRQAKNLLALITTFFMIVSASLSRVRSTIRSVRARALPFRHCCGVVRMRWPRSRRA